jgi:hypothetical protein
MREFPGQAIFAGGIKQMALHHLTRAPDSGGGADGFISVGENCSAAKRPSTSRSNSSFVAHWNLRVIVS